MLDERKNIDDLFQQGLADFEDNMPNYVWGNISDSLRQENKQKRKVVMWWAAASIAILAAFGLGYLLNDWSSSPEIVMAENHMRTVETTA